MKEPQGGSGVNSPEKLEWEINVPIFRNTLILRQLGIAIGIPFGLVALVIIVATGAQWIYALYALALIAALFALTYVLIMVLYGGKYAAAYRIDHNGILNYTQTRQAKRNMWVNGITVILGLATGKPSAAGAGMLAQSRQAVFLKWRDIKKVKYLPEQQTIMLRGSVLESIAVFCDSENYEQVQTIISSNSQV